MSYFNPSKYSSDSNYSSNLDSNSNLDVSNELVDKGHKNIIKVDIDKFDELCKKFKEKKDLKIKNLLGNEKEEFDLMVSYVHLLYGTSYYNTLYEKVKKYFKNVKSVKHGTVGAYFAGCLITNKDDGKINSGCKIGCAGSMPLPKNEEGWNFCDKAVILAEKNLKGYDFSVVKPSDSQDGFDPSYVFVESNSLNDFQGFSTSEKEDLKALGCKSVKLVGYTSDMTYSELYKEPKHVNEIKHRHLRKNKNRDNENNEINISIIIIFILFLLIICCASYIYYKRKIDF